MPEVAGGDDADEFTVDLLIGENGDFRKARHPLILVIEHFEGAKSPAEGNLMLRLDVLIAKNQNLLLHEDIDNLIEKCFVQFFRQVHACNGDTELVRQRLRIQRHRSALHCLCRSQIGKSGQAAR